MVEMPHTISSKHAVVLTFEDTQTTRGAVPGTWRGHGLTHGTVVPVLASVIYRRHVSTRVYV